MRTVVAEFYRTGMQEMEDCVPVLFLSVHTVHMHKI